ncbi:kinase non-catalytic C-lobe domain-containing protein 1 [Chanos chanos]|uniref:Kinase non-catalytic C-lobe domain-containing protein 1 n=1 Tax=Chanos chanos TaxID=29144 RepID=A0A6J2V748_CHACN|nr:kinase non-catalytic C-lobe domain-containing protein 1 [Chanos chanos]
MGTSGTAIVALDNEDNEEEQGYELQHLPPLLEDEENVSLADILCLRDSYLSEQEVWAVCVECVHSLQCIALLPLFHTLCITPDTLAFNAHGNVCFMEQLSDDPEGSFVPPEFDRTGNTFEGHIYSLGATLSAALDFVVEPELEADLGMETRRFLDQMQEAEPENRPHPQDILSLAEAKLSGTSPVAVCRKLSAIGRRVLSIESVANFQDGWEWSYRHAEQSKRSAFTEDQTRYRGMVRNYSSDSYNSSEDQRSQNWGRTHESYQWVEGWHKCSGSITLAREDDPFQAALFTRSQNSSPVRRRNQRLGRARGALNRSCSVPDSNNPPAFLPPSHGDISMVVTDLSEIGAEEDETLVWEEIPQRGDPKRTVEYSDTGWCGDSPSHSARSPEDPRDVGLSQRSIASDLDEVDQPETFDNQILSPSAAEGLRNNSLYSSNNHMTKSMLCLNEESQDEWISLRELLSHCSRPLSVNELWALCYICLSTLQTYIDFPEYLCLDSVYVGCDGEMLFLKPRNTGACDAFYLAPEFQEHGIVTEKACIYGVAAILWATAKFNLSPNQKLAMPRKLKRLLLEMAKRTPIERPSIVLAKKSCRDYLSRQGTNAEAVWTQLINRVHKFLNMVVTLYQGFLPLAGEGKLAPVAGPLPHSYALSTSSQLPEAFTSPATHFTPIVLAQEEGTQQEESPLTDPGTDGTSSESLHCSNVEFLENEDSITPAVGAEPQETETELEDNRGDGVGSNVGVVLRDSSSTSSSGKTLVNSPPLLSPQTTNQETSMQPVATCPAISCGCANGVFNNFLLRQDPQTGLLTLLPVQIAVPEPITGLDLSLPITTVPLQNQPVTNSSPKKKVNHFTEQNNNIYPAYQNGNTSHTLSVSYGTFMSDKSSEDKVKRTTSAAPKSSQTMTGLCRKHPTLHQILTLVREEFAFDGYLENGVEDLAIGEYILSLKGLQFETFCRAITEKYCELFWDEDLLGVLHCLVNHGSSTPSSAEQSPSKQLKRAVTSPQKAGQREERERGENGHLCDHTTACHAPYFNSSSWSSIGVSAVVSLPVGVMERSQCPVGGADESLCESDALWLGEEGLEDSGDGQWRSTCHTDDMDDSDSLISQRTLSPNAGPDGPSYSPSWALAYYGEECFSQEVTNYAFKLGRHSKSPSLEEKTQDPPFLEQEFYQELQQQLTIETRNLRKTRNFYHRLLHQERKNKGSEGKVMLSKLKLQFEELKSKVEFLDSVKKYLQVLSVDQWGLDPAALPSLALSDSPGLDTQSCEDPSALSLVCEQRRGKGSCPLVAGTPLGLMSYLYARNAHLEGYIQQFLYTYRYFCTPEDFLQFLKEKFTTSSRGSQESSADSTKIYHRTLDLLECWIGSCRRVDFTSKTSFSQIMDKFLSSEVSPVDSRGESLLTILQSSPRRRRGNGVSSLCTSPISSQEDEDVQSVHFTCRKSSIDDSGKKSFQWRISRVVEPQAASPKERPYSIAAALPRPCYSSLIQQLSSSCVRNEELLPFSQNEHSAQHTAQQLTLLQQEIFQGCHPVHFLNSRAQGVREKSASMSKGVSSDALPVEGSSLFVSEETEQDGPLQQLLKYAESVSNWVSAEIVICDSVKTQAALLSKFLSMAKFCYENRDFATAMQILGGLEGVIVRQLPAWKQLSSKVCEVLEELRAVQVFLKSDNLCLMEGEKTRGRPTLPSAHILAMHVQQLEIGAFTLTNGTYKWPKLRNIARVVSQVHAFQESVYPYTPDLELQAYLRGRIGRLGTCDVTLLAADNDANFHQLPADRHTRRIQDTLRRVKATFQ